MCKHCKTMELMRVILACRATFGLAVFRGPVGVVVFRCSRSVCHVTCCAPGLSCRCLCVHVICAVAALLCGCSEDICCCCLLSYMQLCTGDMHWKLCSCCVWGAVWDVYYAFVLIYTETKYEKATCV